MSSVEQSLSIDQTVPLSDGIQEGAENQINAEVILRIWLAFHFPPSYPWSIWISAVMICFVFICLLFVIPCNEFR